MQLKEIVDNLLKQRNRSLSWLASQMGKTFDGLKLSLVKESLKYSDLKKMAEVLDVSACIFFKEYFPKEDPTSQTIAEEEVPEYRTVKRELEACKELNEALKDQIKDKEKIISLLNK